MNGQSSAMSPSSGQFLSGEPWAISEMVNQTYNFPNMMAAVLAAALQEEEDKVRRQYVNRGIGADIFVGYDDDTMQIVYSATGSEVADVEYGGATSGPQGLLRKGAIRGADKIKRVLEKGTKA